MPGFNGTGPEGNGSNTGRGRGRCAAATGQQQGQGQGFGQGRQRPGQQGAFADNNPMQGGQARRRLGGRLNQR